MAGNCNFSEELFKETRRSKVCYLCGKVTKGMTNHRRHTETHFIREKRLECQLCTQRFLRSDSHRRHMERKHPDVRPRDYPLVYVIDKFSFAIVHHQEPGLQGTVVEILKPKPTSPRTSSIQPNARDLREAGPSTRTIPPPPATPMATESESGESFWAGLEENLENEEVVTTSDLGEAYTPTNNILAQAMESANITEQDWLTYEWAEEQ